MLKFQRNMTFQLWLESTQAATWITFLDNSRSRLNVLDFLKSSTFRILAYSCLNKTYCLSSRRCEGEDWRLRRHENLDLLRSKSKNWWIRCWLRKERNRSSRELHSCLQEKRLKTLKEIKKKKRRLILIKMALCLTIQNRRLVLKNQKYHQSASHDLNPEMPHPNPDQEQARGQI